MPVAHLTPPGSDAGSDYMAFTKLGYPTAIGTEGNPMRGGSFPGDTNPYIHGVKDTMDVDDDAGFFSIEVGRRSALGRGSAANRGGSMWRDSRSWPLPLRWSRVAGKVPADASVSTFGLKEYTPERRPSDGQDLGDCPAGLVRSLGRGRQGDLWGSNTTTHRLSGSLPI